MLTGVTSLFNNLSICPAIPLFSDIQNYIEPENTIKL